MTTRWHGTSVLITGAAGFIGANLVRRLIELGADVHALVRQSTSLWRLEDVASQLVVHRADLLDPAALRATVHASMPEFIFHLAARGASSHDLDAAQLLQANTLGTLHLLEATQPFPYARFIHVGGSSEYGPHAEPLKESDRLEPATSYGASKAAATLACQQFARAQGRPVVIVRPFSVYGPWEAPSRLIPTAILAAFEQRELPLTSPGYRRDLVYVADVVEALLLAATRDIAPGEIVNVGTGQEWTNEEVVRTIERVSGRPIHARVGDYRPRLSDSAHWVADVTKAARLLGWKAERTLDVGIEDTISWWAAHRRESHVLD
jgi:nucleoside-diphosphate-sugar epimerase